jgi:hypothetical protein
MVKTSEAGVGCVNAGLVVIFPTNASVLGSLFLLDCDNIIL